MPPFTERSITAEEFSRELAADPLIRFKAGIGPPP
jgi:hypothetical protein